MKIEVLKSKLHRATVTDSNLNYEGSITIDTELLKKANMHIWEKVDVLNVNNGARFSTYIIPGKSGQICLNGAAARKFQVGDEVIIMSYAYMLETEAITHKPIVIFPDESNRWEQ